MWPTRSLRSNRMRRRSPCPPASEGGNLFNRMVLDKGNVDRALARAAAVVEGVYETGYQEHAYLETQGAVAVPEELGAMAVYGSMQCPFYVQNAVAKVLGLPLAKVRVVAAATGGAFGGKEDVPSLIGSLAAIGAWATRRPVKLVLTREEDVLTTSKRHPAVVRYKTAADADGRITAIDVDIVLNAGAYQTLSSAVLWRSLVTAAGPYRVPNVRVVARSVATNTVPNGAFRGFGSPQVIFPHESQMDLLAEKLALDRVEIRRRNVLHAGDRTSTDHLVRDSVGISDTLERAAELADWSSRLAADRVRQRDIDGDQTRTWSCQRDLRRRTGRQGAVPRQGRRDDEARGRRLGRRWRSARSRWGRV